MGERTYNSLRQELMQLYKVGEYGKALDLIEKEQAGFPDETYDISCWRLNLNASLDKPEEALQVFRESLDKGSWFPPKWLEEDPDFAALLLLPAFQEMIEICRQHLAQAQREAQPGLLVRQPAQQTTALPLLLALHGNANNMRSTVGHWDGITAEGWLLGVPQSSQAIGPDAFIWDDREKSTSEIRDHLARLNKEHKIDPERVMLGGFSMGGGQAIWMALHQSIKTPGFVTLGPYLNKAELEALPALLEKHKPAGLRGSILVGEEDTTCLEISRKIAEILHTYDLPCELEVRPGLDHSYPADFGAWVTKGLAFVEQA